MFPSRWIEQIARRMPRSRGRYNPFQFRPKVEPLEERQNPSNVLANSFTSFAQTQAAVARDLIGDSVIVWQSNTQDGSSFGIYGQKFDAGGNPISSEFRVNTTTQNAQSHPVVAMDQFGGFVVVWESMTSSGNTDLRGQRFAADGSMRGSEFLVNQTTAGNQNNPTLAMDLDGDFVVAWTSENQDGSGLGVYARRFQATPNTGEGESDPRIDSPEFRVNTTTLADQTTPDVAVDSNGNFTIVWSSFNSGLTSFDVMGQQYDAQGVAQGGEFRINSFQNEAQFNPKIATDFDGNFVVVWQSLFQDGSNFGIYGQRFSANSTPVGSEFRVNDTTTGAQITPDVATTLRGDFVVVWDSVGQDGSGDGIYTKSYSRTGQVISGESIVNTVTTGSQLHPAVAMDSNGIYTIVWDSPGVDGDVEGIVFENRILQPNLAPVATSIPPVTVNEDSAPTLINLRNFFEDDFTPDPLLRFSVVDDTPETILGSLVGASVDLNGNLLITYIPNLNGTTMLTIRATDLSGAFTESTLMVTVNSVNDAPTDLSLGSASLNETSPTGTTIGTFSTSDIDNPDTFTYTLVSGDGASDNAQFQIVGDQLQTLTVQDFETGSPTRTIRVRTTDSGGASFEKSFVITIFDVAEAPTNLMLTGNSVTENVDSGTIVGTFSSMDEDAGDSATFELFDDGSTPTDNFQFGIVNGNQLVTAAPIDFEDRATRTILVRVTDSTGLSQIQTFTINVVNVDEAPTNFQRFFINPLFENAGPNFAFLQLSAFDPEGGPVTFSFDETGGVFDNNLFSITGPDLDQIAANNSFDFETQSQYQIQVRATDAAGNGTTISFFVGVTDVNEAPTNLMLDNMSVPENQSFFTVGSFRVDDPDLNDPITYTLEPGAGDTDNFRFEIVGNTLRTQGELDFENTPPLSIRVLATDSGGLTTEQTFTITVIDNNDRPTFTPGPNVTASLGVPNVFPNWATDISPGSPGESEQTVQFVIDFVTDPTIFADGGFPAISPDGTLTFTLANSNPFNGFFSVQVFYRLQDNGGSENGGQDFSAQSSFSVTIDPTQIVSRGGPTTVNTSSGVDHLNSNVAHDALGNYVVVWQQRSNYQVPSLFGSDSDIFAQRFDSFGNALGDEFLVNRLTDGDQVTPTVAMDADGDFVVVWAESEGGQSPGPTFLGDASSIVAQRFDASGNFVGDEFAIATSNNNNQFSAPDAAMDPGGNFLVTWTDRFEMFVPGPSSGGSFITLSQIHASRFDANGNPVIEDVLVSAPNQFANNSAVAIDQDGEAVVVWEASIDFEGLDVYGQLIDSVGGLNGSNFRINQELRGDQFTPDVAMDPLGNFVVAWDDYYITFPIVARRFDAQGQPLADEFLVATGSGFVHEPRVAIRSDGLFAIAWHDDQGDTLGGSTSSVSFQVYRPDGLLFGSTIQASEFNSSNDRNAAIILSDVRDEIVVTWESDQTGRLDILQGRYVLSAAPSGVNLFGNSIDENAPPGTVVGSLFGQDPDFDRGINETFTYQVSFNEGDPFSYDSETNEIISTDTLDFETVQFYAATVTVTDSTGLVGTFTVFINVQDNNDAPTDISLTDADTGSSESVEIEFNAFSGTNVGFFNTYDRNFDSPFTYTLLDNAGGRFEVIDDTLFVADSSQLTIGTYTITVRSTDPGGLSFDKDFTINVTDDDDVDPPTINISGSSGFESDEETQFFAWDISDFSGLSDVQVVIRQFDEFGNSTILFTSSAPSGEFPFDDRGLGDFSIEINATDNDNDRPDDMLTNSNSHFVTVFDDDTEPPVTTIGGSSGIEDDGQQQLFTWNVNDFSGSGASFAQVQITQTTPDGRSFLLFNQFTSSVGSFNFDQFGLGTFDIMVTGFDDDNDRSNDSLSSTATQSVTVFDDDTAGPQIELTGSSGTQLDNEPQQFTWNVTDFSGGVPTARVEVFRTDLVTNERVRISTDDDLISSAMGSFNFDDFGPGFYEIFVTGLDDDNDWGISEQSPESIFPFGDQSSSTTLTLSVTVFDDMTQGPNVEITGSSGDQDDGQMQQFNWSVTPFSGGTTNFSPSFISGGQLTTQIRVFTLDEFGNRSESPIFEDLMALPIDSFNFDDLGPGSYEIEVTGIDDDHDFPANDFNPDGDQNRTVMTRRVTVFDDDVNGPSIVLLGSGANDGVSLPSGSNIETDGQDQTFSWSVNDFSSGVASTSVIVRQNGNVIFSSGSTEGTFDFNQFGLGDFIITVSARDADNDFTDEFGGDSSSSFLSRSVTVIDDDLGPDLVLGGSQGVQSDEETQAFSWDFNTLSPEGSVVSTAVFKDGAMIFSSADLSGGFNFDELGVGTYTIVVFGTDGDNDREGDRGSVIDARSVVVFDDVPVPPVITVGGSTGEVPQRLPQEFTWTTSSDSLGAVLSVFVTVTQDGRTIFTSRETSGVVNLTTRGLGEFVFSIQTSDSDVDHSSDEGIAVGIRSAKIFDDSSPPTSIDDDPPVVEPPVVEPPVIEPPVVEPPTPPPTPPPAPVRTIVNFTPIILGLSGSLPFDSGTVMGGDSSSSSGGGEEVAQTDTVISLRELGNVAILLSDVSVNAPIQGQIGLPEAVSEQLGGISAQPDELKSPQTRPIALPSVAVSSILDGDDSVRLIEQLDRMSVPIQVSTPRRGTDRGPMNPPSIEFLPDDPTISESKSDARAPSADATQGELPMTDSSAIPAEVSTELPVESSMNGSLGWIVAGALALQGVAFGCRRWLLKQLGIR